MSLLTGGMVCLYLLQGWAQARAQLAAVSSGRWELAVLHISPTTTQGWRDFSVVSHKSPECPQISVNALHTGSVSSVIFGKVGKSRVLVFLQSELPVQVRPLFTARVFHTLLLETMVETGVCQTQSGLSLFQMKNTRQIPNQMGRGVHWACPGQTKVMWSPTKAWKLSRWTVLGRVVGFHSNSHLNSVE